MLKQVFDMRDACALYRTSYDAASKHQLSESVRIAVNETADKFARELTETKENLVIAQEGNRILSQKLDHYEKESSSYEKKIEFIEKKMEKVQKQLDETTAAYKSYKKHAEVKLANSHSSLQVQIDAAVSEATTDLRRALEEKSLLENSLTPPISDDAFTQTDETAITRPSTPLLMPLVLPTCFKCESLKEEKRDLMKLVSKLRRRY